MGRAGGEVLTSPRVCRRHMWASGARHGRTANARQDRPLQAWTAGTRVGSRHFYLNVHWPSYDFTQDQSWCCDSWCYVDATTCTPELQAKYGISLGDSWTGAALKYSYDACADPWSAPQALEAVDYSPQTFSQVTLHVCGVACQHGAAGWC